ncbi:MAG: NUDIX domain-containing protein [Candidatus Saccharibacteria bacterium]|nr:NUDIX domain-containing protein [Candidatus Saccharibacteria bacterium]
MRRAVRAIIIKDKKLLVMHRNKFGDEYDTLPGGNVEVGETLEEALRREVTEETMVNFDGERLVFLEHAGHPYGDQYVYLCKYQSGEPQLHPDSEEEQINRLGKNLYRPAWLALSDLPTSPFLSKKLKEHILHGVEHGWPKKSLEFKS